MGAFRTLLSGVTGFNTALLRVGRTAAWVCVAIMVLVVLAQVLFRYVLQSLGVADPLSWSEEAARALMIWMTAFAAPTAYRYGGFVAIDMFRGLMPPPMRRALGILFLLAAFVVLVQLVLLAIPFFERGFRTRAGSFDLPRAWIYLAMLVCFASMLLVNIEMVLREIGRAIAGDDAFPSPAYWSGEPRAGDS